MDFSCGGGAGGSGGDESGQGVSGSGGIKRKRDDFQTTMKARMDALVKENEEKSAKIRKLMEENVRNEETIFRLENPSYASEQIIGGSLQNPFLVFPKVVWEAKIEKMNRSSDLERLCLTYPLLEPLVMERKKTIVLFKNVFPLICKHLLGKDILKCRLVCGTWNEEVCAFVANNMFANLHPNDPLRTNNQIVNKASLPDPSDPQLAEVAWNLVTLQLRSAYQFLNVKKLENFLIKMVDHFGNPFFGRYLCFYARGRTDFEHFWNSALELVRTFGEHVWNLEISCTYGGYRDNDQIDFYKAVQQVLVHLPNLKYLSIKNKFTGKGSRKMDMAVKIQNSPLPPLPYLQSFELALNGVPGMNNAFSTYISSQILRLILLSNSFANLTNESLRGLLNVEQLEVELHSTEDVSRLLKLPNPKSVKKLRLQAASETNYFEPCKPPVSLAPGQFVSLLETFSALESPLNIGRCQVDLSSFLNSRERFSGLTTLEIDVGVYEDDRQHNLDFLLSFQSLKHLVIRREIIGCPSDIPREDFDQNSTLKIRNYVTNHRMFESNIWGLIPSLQLLKSGNYRTFTIFTREMYENLRTRKAEMQLSRRNENLMIVFV